LGIRSTAGDLDEIQNDPRDPTEFAKAAAWEGKWTDAA
jgi:hypothetical protein